jgi:hypothetical protein
LAGQRSCLAYCLNGQHTREQVIECCEKCRLDVFCRYGNATERQGFCGARVMRQNALEAKVGSGASRRVNAHLSHHSSDDKLGHFKLSQMFEQRCFTKAVWEILLSEDASISPKFLPRIPLMNPDI